MAHGAIRHSLLRRGLWASVFMPLLLPGCHGSDRVERVDVSMSSYRDRMLTERETRAADFREQTARPVQWQSELPEKPAVMSQPPVTTQPAPEEILDEVPDPSVAEAALQARLQRLKDADRPDMRVINNYSKVVAQATEYLERIEEPRKVRLSLAECIQRTLEHNYAIRFDSYKPAISQTQVVEAEAAFDAEFFLEGSWSSRDQATASQLQANTADTRTYGGGFRKLLPTGMQVQTRLDQSRTDTTFQFQTLNPAYDTSFSVSFTQPLMRNFGLEFNRAQINIRRAQWDISNEEFIQQVRDTLLEVERTYWQLVQARRTASILAETVAQNRVTYLGIQDRIEHDATQVELNNAQSRWKNREVDFLEAVRTIRDQEDLLKNLMNDPVLKLSENIEIVPTDTPFVAALSLDLLGAVRTALDERSEIRAARRAIDQARIQTMTAKNQTMPQLDLSFQYEVQGIGGTADNSFDNLTTNRFISYTVSAVFSFPIGNRGPRAALRRARLQESQSVVGLYRAIDAIVQEVNFAVRALNVRYAQIPPQLEAVNASRRNLQALQARTQRIDPLYLDNELNSVERLANSRTQLLGVITEYNIAIAGLEKAKGTLLEYNNVVVTDAPPDR